MRFLIFFRRLLLLLVMMSSGISPRVIAEVIRKAPFIDAIQSAQNHSHKQQRPTRQTSFGGDSPIQLRVELPSSVLEILQTDTRNQTCLLAGQSQKDIPASWFTASRIRLRNDGGEDLIVMPANSCLYGANITPFWIFSRRGGRYELVLNANGLVLDVLTGRTRKYRDIRLTSLSSNVQYVSIYKFNGTAYTNNRSFTRPIQ